MKFLVTGGAGFIGSNIVKLLVEEGHQVAVIDNLSSGYIENLIPYPNVDFIQDDIRDTNSVNRSMEGCEGVFHLAASVGNLRSIENPIEDSEINVLGTLRVLEAARKHNVMKVVYSSSAGIFGELIHLPIKEDHPIEPDTPYGASKLAGEKLCLAYSKIYPSLECVCLRYFNVYGINQRYDAYGNVIPIFAQRIFDEKPITIFGNGEQTRDFVNVRDVAYANYRAAITKGLSGAFNIASGTRITINELAKMMFQISGKDEHLEYGDNRPGDVLHSLADISAAKNGLKFSPEIGLKEGLTEYLGWFFKNA